MEEKCSVRVCVSACKVNGNVWTLLLDTGVQVSTMSWSFLNNFYPELEGGSLTDIPDDCDWVSVHTGNTTDIPFSDWVEMTLSVRQESQDKGKVPFWIITDDTNNPITGFNAMKTLVQDHINIVLTPFVWSF